MALKKEKRTSLADMRLTTNKRNCSFCYVLVLTWIPTISLPCHCKYRYIQVRILLLFLLKYPLEFSTLQEFEL